MGANLDVSRMRCREPSPREAGRGWPERSEGRVRGNTLRGESPKLAHGAGLCPSPASPPNRVEDAREKRLWRLWITHPLARGGVGTMSIPKRTPTPLLHAISRSIADMVLR